ncbi:MAG: ATP-binding cassette domain-containing protein, partial [Acidimicrobiia bacterium]|nr:ATP-binding cassette domain-containing protein [Acidimicrobiia bacterium]
MTLSAVIRATRGNFRLDVSFDVADGETLAVLGPNGAGKSTILRCLLGLVPLDTGRIVLGDHVLEDTTNNLYVEPENRRVGAVFQDYLLFRHLSVIDNVAFGLRARGAKKESARLTARAHLERFEVEHLADRRPSQLSGGEAQRVALARALAVDPKVLLLDEPLAALDVTTRRTVRDELSLFLSAFGGPRLFVTHDPADARRLADRVLIVEHGSVVQHGSIRDVMRDPATPYVA